MAKNSRGTRIGGPAARKRIEPGGAALEQPASGPTPDVPNVFHERMRRLASRTCQATGALLTESWIVCSISGEAYAVRAACLRGIARIEHITRPCGMGAGVLGVICHAGRMLTLLDARALLGLYGGGAAEIGDRILILLPSEESSGIALRVDDATGAMELSDAQIAEARESYMNNEAHILGRMANGVTLVDLPALLTKVEAAGGDEN